LILILVCFAGVWISAYRSQASIPPGDLEKTFIEYREKLNRPIIFKDLKLDPTDLSDHIVLERGEERFIVESSLDQSLQDYIVRLLRRSQTLRAAVVVLSCTDGRVLAMTSYHKDKSGEDLCLKADFPAASLFKIVSAAAALESAGYKPDKAVYYWGKRHTLYKKQLKTKITRYTEKTSFKKAFASSINPVFGKLGIYDLGQDVMTEYGGKFLFNHIIPFDFPVEMSTVQVPEDDFGLAEIASGFNKQTKISPLHAALLASVAANNGVMVTPWLVENVKNESGEFFYQRRPTRLALSVSRKTAKNLKVLMRDTVIYGTCRKSFRPLRRKRVFKGVELGAKTGTINDEADRFKYDWLTAYALPKDRAKAICIAVLGVHDEKLGIRANELGRYIINYHISS
jgi:cell division protein FtsI/penicillin-binding protein 2